MALRRYGWALAAALAAVCTMAFWFFGCGGGDDAQPGIQSKFLVTTDTEGDGLTVFRINASTGELTYVDNVSLSGGDNPTMLALHPNGRFVYVANSNAPAGSWGGSANIRVFAYNSDNVIGAEIAGSPFSTSSGDPATFVNLAITPNGKYLYVNDVSTDCIRIFKTFDNGALLETDDSVVLTASEPHGIAVHGSGKFLFVIGTFTSLQSFSIADNGALTEATNSPYTFGVGNPSQWLSVTPNLKFLYAVGSSGYVTGGSIDQMTGELTLLPDLPITTGVGEKGSAFVPSGKFLYTANFYDSSVGAYAVADNGALTAVSGQPFATGAGPKNVSVTRDGKYLYVANYGDSSVEAFGINSSTGVLTSIATYQTGFTGPKFLTTLP